jgi:hypothetical protein
VYNRLDWEPMVQLNDEERILWDAKPLKMPFLSGLFVIVPLGFALFFAVTYVTARCQVWPAPFSALYA